MSDLPKRGVVDASAGIKLFVSEPLSETAEKLFSQLGADPEVMLAVPDLFFAECGNVLWKYVRRSGYPEADARGDVAALAALALRSYSTADLIADALEIALRLRITVYDACYVALSERLAVPLVTADEALSRKLAGSPHDVRWLGGFAG